MVAHPTSKPCRASAPRRHPWALRTASWAALGPPTPLCSAAVELPSADAGVEAGSSSLLREHCGLEAGGADPPHRALPGLSDQRGETSQEKMLCVIRNVPTPGSRAAARDEPALQSWAMHASARRLPAEWDRNASWFHLAAAPPRSCLWPLN